MIKTKSFKIEPSQLQNLLIISYLKKRWWFFVFIALMVGLTYILEGLEDMRIFWLVFAAIFPMLIVWQFWRYAHSKENKIFYLERQLVVDGDTIEAKLEDGTVHPVLSSHIIHYEDLKSWYKLNVSKSTYILIPKEAFESSEDETEFKSGFLSQLSKK